MAVSKQTPGSQEERDSDAVITKDRRNWALPKTNKQKKKKKTTRKQTRKQICSFLFSPSGFAQYIPQSK